MIFHGDRGAKGEMTVVDHDRKSYFLMDDATVSNMTAQVSSAMSQMQQMLKNLPPEQRRAAEAMIKRRGGSPMGAAAAGPEPVIEVKATGQSDVVNDYPCDKYEVFRDGVKIRELCTTEWSNIDGGSEASGVFERMSEFAKALREAFSKMPGANDNPNPYAEMNFADGFPVHTVSLGKNGKKEQEWQLKSSRRETIDPAEFEPPKGYKRMSMTGL